MNVGGPGARPGFDAAHPGRLHEGAPTRTVLSVTYEWTSGSVAPQYQWSREYIITPDRVVLSSWGGEQSGTPTFTKELSHSQDAIQDLFRTLSTANHDELVIPSADETFRGYVEPINDFLASLE